MLPFIAAVLPTLIEVVPSLIRIFGNSPTSEKNARAAEIVVNAAKEATGAVNEQDLLDKLRARGADDIAAVEQAVKDVWYDIVVDTGGIEAARAASEKNAMEFYKQPALYVTLLLLPLPYLVVTSVLGFVGSIDYGTEIRIMVISAILSGVLSGITGFWLGTSFSSSRKTELLSGKS